MGRLRGQRNSDQDRYWQERRKASQAGMINADDVSLCCFCGGIVVSDEAGYTRIDELFCRLCGQERGLVNAVRVKGTGAVATLQSVEAIGGWTDQRGGPGGTARGHLVGFDITISRQPTTWESSTDRRANKVSRLYERALLWARRDRSIGVEDASAEAGSVAEMSLECGRQAVEALKYEVYRQKHPRRKCDVPRKLTDAKAEEIRRRYATGTESYKRLGAEFGVTGAHIAGIVTGSVYRSAGGPIHIPNMDRAIYRRLGVVGRVVWPWDTYSMAGT